MLNFRAGTKALPGSLHSFYWTSFHMKSQFVKFVFYCIKLISKTFYSLKKISGCFVRRYDWSGYQIVMVEVSVGMICELLWKTTNLVILSPSVSGSRGDKCLSELREQGRSQKHKKSSGCRRTKKPSRMLCPSLFLFNSKATETGERIKQQRS